MPCQLGVTLTLPDLDVTPVMPETVTVTDLATWRALPLTVTDVCPSGTVTLAGTLRAMFDDLSVTNVPPAGAAPVRLIVRPTLPPLTTVPLLATMELITGGTTLIVAFFFSAPSWAIT